MKQMKVKSSLFNTCTTFGEHTILYNSLSGDIISMTSAERLRQLIQNEISVDMDNPLDRRLINGGFLVSESEDEAALVSLSNYEKMFNPELAMTILPTEECNFRCKYCYEEFKQGEMGSDVQQSFLKWFQKNVSKYASVQVSWFGGEPLVGWAALSHLSTQMLEIAHNRGIPYSSAITTNGYLLTLERFRCLLKYRVSVFQITIDGLERHHDQFRCLKNGDGTFQRIISNLLEIKNNIRSHSFRIVIRTNISLNTLPYIDEYVQYMHNLFGGDNRFEFFFRPVGDWGGERVQAIKNSLTSDLATLYTTLLNSDIVLNYAAYRSLLTSTMCLAGNRNSYILRADGRICKCTMLLDDERNTIGYFSSTGEMILDKFMLAKWVRPETLNEECSLCAVRPACNGRTCPAKGFILKSTGMCGYENYYVEYVLKLLDRANAIERYGDHNRFLGIREA